MTCADDALTAEERAAFLRGVALCAEACAAALLNEPGPAVVEGLARASAALGDGAAFSDIACDAKLTQRYYDRMFVSCSPFFVPLVESCIVRRTDMDGRVRYGNVGGAACDHVTRCYKAVGFDFRALQGYDVAVRALHPDSLACELSFMAALAWTAAEGGTGARRAGELLDEFVRRHTRWFDDAAACLAARADDLYARAARLAATLARSLCEGPAA